MTRKGFSIGKVKRQRLIIQGKLGSIQSKRGAIGANAGGPSFVEFMAGAAS